MGWKQFVVDLVDALAWPTGLVVVVVLLRDPLVRLLPQVRRLRYRDFELEFGQELELIKDDVDQAIPEQPIPEEKRLELKERVRELSSISPAAAIAEIWMEVEGAARDALQRHGLSVSRATPRVLRRELEQRDLVNRDQSGVFERLRQIRNLAVHAGDVALSDSDVLEFTNLGLRLIQYFESL